MNPIRSTVALVFALLLPAGAAFAQADKAERAQQMAAEMQKRFAAADANADGKLTKDEAKGKMPFVYKHFDEIDTAHSGAVTLADIATFVRTKQAARKAAP
jgi:Ca2+-binding EF-hand superfamily protein